MIEPIIIKAFIIGFGSILFVYGLITITGCNPFTYGREPTNYRWWSYITLFSLVFFCTGTLL